MKISVVTGCYNHARQLPKLLKSLTEQRKYLHEWLICDDGSDDPATIELLKEYEKLSNVRVFRQENKGMRLAKSLNNGFRSADGDLMFVVMGDTYLEKGVLQELKESYIRDTAGCGVRKNVDENGNLISWDWRLGSENLLGHKIVFRHKHSANKMTGNSMIVTLEHLKKIGYWPEEYEGYGYDDWAVFTRLEKIEVHIVAYNNIVVNHIAHKNVITENPKNKELFMKEWGENLIN